MNPEPSPDGGKKIVLGGRSYRHLAHSVLLDEAVAPRHVRVTITLLLATIAVFVIWAWFAELDTVASTSGQITPSGAVQVVQHLDGGTITRIEVADGQRVSKGQLLIALDRVETEVELRVTELRYWAQTARIIRLRIEGSDRGGTPNFEAIPSEHAAFVRDQIAILEAHRLARSNQEAIIRAQIAQLEADLSRVDRQIASSERETQILREVTGIRTELEKDKLVTRVQSLETQRTLTVQEGEVQRLRAQRNASQASIKEAHARLVSLSSDRRQAALDEMGVASAELAQVSELLVKLRKRVERLDIAAPVNGIVQDLKYRTVGGVIAPGAVVMNVVPLEDVLQAEVRIAATDIGHVHVGQLARVKVLTYDFLRYGTIDGRLATVSASSFLDDKNIPYFKGIVHLSRGHLGPSPNDLPILPGMTVSCDIVTDRKTVLEYLMRPLVIAFKQGLRER